MKISIITVVYNAKDDLEKTLSSIRGQVFKDFELIIVDGKSTDGTLNVINENIDLIDIMVSEPDDGLYYAMNKGNVLASGDFALFMNSGDIFVDNNSLENISKYMIDPNIFYFGNTIIYFDNTFKIAPKTHHQSVFFPKEFYKNESYDSVTYKITAEADYIFKALDKHHSEHIDVDLILSKLEGFRVHRYSTLSEAKKIYKEVVHLMKQHKKNVPFSFKMTYLIKSILKFVAFKVGGLPLVAKMLLFSYESTSRKYNIDN